jgi:hypothetical protein
VCGATFSIARALEYEARGACIRAHEDVIHAASRRSGAMICTGIWDKDLEKFMEKYADAIREGRKTI